MNVKPEKKTVAIGLLMRDTDQSIKVKSCGLPFIVPRLVIRRAVKAVPGCGRGSVLVGFSLSLFYSTYTVDLFTVLGAGDTKRNMIIVLKRLFAEIECFFPMETFE